MTDIPIKYNVDKVSLLKVPLIFVIVVLFTGTFLRISLLVLYPFIAAIVFFFLRLQLTKYIIYLFALILIGWLLSFFNGFYPGYNLLSLFYMLPFILLLLSEPIRYEGRRNWVPLFFYIFSIVGVINDIPGILQVIFLPESDDNFIGIYSRFSLSINGLAVLNSLLFLYYCFSFFSYKKTRHLFAALFFLICSFLGFYGAGLMALIAAFILTFLSISWSSIIKTVFISILSLVVVYYALSVIKPQVLAYNETNLERIYHFNEVSGPRKIVSFLNYFRSYPSHIRNFLFGSGPGTFNSRSAFMIGSPYFLTILPQIKSDKKPPYFRDYAYPLWNNTNTSQALLQDGFRNQPFSSLLAFLGEYGLVFTLLFVFYMYQTYKKVVQNKTGVNMPPQYYLYTRLFKCFLLLLMLLMVIDNYLEYPEITLLIVVVLKLLHIEIKKIQTLA